MYQFYFELIWDIIRLFNQISYWHFHIKTIRCNWLSRPGNGIVIPVDPNPFIIHIGIMEEDQVGYRCATFVLPFGYYGFFPSFIYHINPQDGR